MSGGSVKILAWNHKQYFIWKNRTVTKSFHRVAKLRRRSCSWNNPQHHQRHHHHLHFWLTRLIPPVKEINFKTQNLIKRWWGWGGLCTFAFTCSVFSDFWAWSNLLRSSVSQQLQEWNLFGFSWKASRVSFRALEPPGTYLNATRYIIQCHIKCIWHCFLRLSSFFSSSISIFNSLICNNKGKIIFSPIKNIIMLSLI